MNCSICKSIAAGRPSRSAHTPSFARQSSHRQEWRSGGASSGGRGKTQGFRDPRYKVTAAWRATRFQIMHWVIPGCGRVPHTFLATQAGDAAAEAAAAGPGAAGAGAQPGAVAAVPRPPLVHPDVLRTKTEIAQEHTIGLHRQTDGFSSREARQARRRRRGPCPKSKIRSPIYTAGSRPSTRTEL
jgi:hypothetical protein